MADVVRLVIEQVLTEDFLKVSILPKSRPIWLPIVLTGINGYWKQHGTTSITLTLIGGMIQQMNRTRMMHGSQQNQIRKTTTSITGNVKNLSTPAHPSKHTCNKYFSSMTIILRGINNIDLSNHKIRMTKVPFIQSILLSFHDYVYILRDGEYNMFFFIYIMCDTSKIRW